MNLYCSVQLRLRRRECEIILPFNFRAPLPLSVPGPGEWEGNNLIFRSRRASATLFVNPLLSLQHGNTAAPHRVLSQPNSPKNSSYADMGIASQEYICLRRSKMQSAQRVSQPCLTCNIIRYPHSTVLSHKYPHHIMICPLKACRFTVVDTPTLCKGNRPCSDVSKRSLVNFRDSHSVLGHLILSLALSAEQTLKCIIQGVLYYLQSVQ